MGVFYHHLPVVNNAQNFPVCMGYMKKEWKFCFVIFFMLQVNKKMDISQKCREKQQRSVFKFSFYFPSTKPFQY